VTPQSKTEEGNEKTKRPKESNKNHPKKKKRRKNQGEIEKTGLPQVGCVVYSYLLNMEFSFVPPC